MQSQINQVMARAIHSFQAGNFNETEILLSQVLKNQSRNFDALHILGIVKGTKNLHREALELFKKALRINSSNSFLHFNIAKSLSEIGEEEKALKYHLTATKLNPKYPEGWLNYGKSLSNLNRFEESLGHYTNALALNPEYAEAWTNQGCSLTKLKDFEKALASFGKSLEINPKIAETWSNRGIAFSELKQHEQALECYNKAIDIKPDYAEAWSNRGIALSELKQYEQALASYTRAIDIKPDYAEAWSNRGSVLCSICQFGLAEASYREAIRIDPENLILRSSWLFSLNYFESLNSSEIFAEAHNYGVKASKNITPKFTEWKPPSDSKKLKIGFVSGDFSNHPVGYFIEGLIEHLDSSRFEIYAFPTQPTKDDLTNRITPFFEEWTPIYGKSNFDAASTIHQKGIHVLIDLSGHSAGNRLPVFSYKPAPVQASWLGFFATTGLPEMDYFLGDPYLSPANENNHFTETVWNLPETWLCHKPTAFQLPVSDLPALTNGFLTFGSFGNLSKMNDRVIKAWALVLHQAPRSKLLLKAKQFADTAQIREVQKRFEGFDISADRLMLEGPDSRVAYFQTYNRVDFVLDTFPYPGGTTSVDALWMGVPVLTLKGNRFLSHLGESIAINAGLSEWIAQDAEDYVNKAVQFASNLERLAQLRSALRPRILKSPLFDPSRFARNFGDALLGMWNQRSKVNRKVE